MAEYTLTYSDKVQGFPSFYSFIPDMTVGMNSKFYSFKSGSLWLHNSDNVTRNNYYATQYESQLTGVFNKAVLENKLFKNIWLEGEDEWDVTLETDQQNGYIEKEWFEKKEGVWYSFVRNNNQDFNLRSANGIGYSARLNSADLTDVGILFDESLGSVISIGDGIWTQPTNQLTPSFVGTLVNINQATNRLGVDTTVAGGSVPVVGDFMFYVKNNIAESHGVLGHYCKFIVTNDNTTSTELYSVRSEVMKSYP